jgi:hypothetical protein
MYTVSKVHAAALLFNGRKPSSRTPSGAQCLSHYILTPTKRPSYRDTRVSGETSSINGRMDNFVYRLPIEILQDNEV